MLKKRSGKWTNMFHTFFFLSRNPDKMIKSFNLEARIDVDDIWLPLMAVGNLNENKQNPNQIQ